MSSSELKYNLHLLIESISDSSKLQNIYNIFSKSKTKEVIDWYDELPNNIVKDLETSLTQSEKQETISHSDVTNQLNKRYPQLNL